MQPMYKSILCIPHRHRKIKLSENVIQFSAILICKRFMSIFSCTCRINLNKASCKIRGVGGRGVLGVQKFYRACARAIPDLCFVAARAKNEQFLLIFKDFTIHYALMYAKNAA